MAGLSREQFMALAAARSAVLATVSADGRPRTVPICFVIGMTDDGRPAVYSAIDDKPKAEDDPLALARIRDIAGNPLVSVLVDRWDEEWSHLGWLRIDGRAAVVQPPPAVVSALREKYPQYADHRLESRPMIRITVERARGWGTLAGD
ncbi:MAG: TIGR03668 family PPOX class F420-dependent oxidoreductase [Chloroflexota bacterium]